MPTFGTAATAPLTAPVPVLPRSLLWAKPALEEEDREAAAAAAAEKIGSVGNRWNKYGVGRSIKKTLLCHTNQQRGYMKAIYNTICIQYDLA